MEIRDWFVGRRARARAPYWVEVCGYLAACVALRRAQPVCVVALVASVCGWTPFARAADLPLGFVEQRIATGLDPTAFVIAPDGRLFVTEKSGAVRVVKDHVLLDEPFATVDTDNYNEQGLIGIVLDPSFDVNGYVYLMYTVHGDQRRNRVSRLVADGDRATGDETVLFELSPRVSGIHNGGSLAFGPDRKLYVGSGDDSIGDHAQSLDTLHGKILRLDPDGSVPSDNPFAWLSAPYDAIWALGVRNPFTIAFHPTRGLLYFNDVGSGASEEINAGEPAANYGWPRIEGERNGQAAPENYYDPVYAYSHDEGCAVTAGTFYAPASRSFPTAYEGQYLFADYCRGYIKRLDPDTGEVSAFATGINRPLSIQVAPDGSLYYIARAGLGGGSEEDNTSSSDGELYHVRYTGTFGPAISVQPRSETVALGQAATFIVAASGSQPISYQWQRDGLAIPSATNPSYTTPPTVTADDGSSYAVEVTNAFGTVLSDAAILRVGAGNEAPSVVLTGPDPTYRYVAGDVLEFSASANDPEDGPLPPSALTFWIDFHHDTHTHPALGAQTDVNSISYAIPRNVEISANVWYRVYVRARDSSGRSTIATRDIHPATSTFTLTTEPPGLWLLLDGQPVTTPVAVTGVAGVTRTVEAPLTRPGLIFESWSDGGARQHTFDTGAEDVTLAARYVELLGGATGLRGEYFPSRELAGSPVLVRREAVDFDWRFGSPAVGIVADEFSVRWTGEIEAPVGGEYVFTTVSDDGVRLWVDDVLLIDRWDDHSRSVDDAEPIWLDAGQRYRVRLEYYEGFRDSEIRLHWRYPGVVTHAVPGARVFPPRGSGLEARYVRGSNPDGAAVLTRIESIDFDWGYGSPSRRRVGANNFSVRWTGEVEAPVTGPYVFSTVSDDGIRMWFDGQLLIDDWDDRTRTVDEAPEVMLVAGQRYTTQVDYRESYGRAEARLQWRYPGVASTTVPATYLFPKAGSGLAAAYFNNETVSGAPVFEQLQAVDFDWQRSSPAAGIVNADGFSVRWTGELLAPVTGEYVFTTLGDDGLRLWVGGTLMIDAWNDRSGMRADSTPVVLNEGERYPIQLEYYENSDTAEVHLQWSHPEADTSPIPISQLFPPSGSP